MASSSSSNTTHLVQDLNNFLQQRGMVNDLTWSCKSYGPQKKLEWVAIAYIRGVEYGRGSAHTKRLAKEIAAARALHGLNSAESVARAEADQVLSAEGDAAMSEGVGVLQYDDDPDEQEDLSVEERRAHSDPM